ncbi:small integral membrane protein 14 isoform X2 [Artibeus jamaicensis]|uniref:small integral membrane protein 14 isoform X2 n=1 Tax=Artibeus jamaicensis TaxID=9417 RepID=UPI00235AC7B0|nr:small integral membrane protein 14 isoform X2 [Artibeus jamaicensis]
MRGRQTAGVSSLCNLLRRRPRKRVDPGLVVYSDVVSRTKTEEGRKPEAKSSTRSVRKLQAVFLPTLGPGPHPPRPVGCCLGGGDRTCNFGIPGQCSNQLNYPPRALSYSKFQSWSLGGS